MDVERHETEPAESSAANGRSGLRLPVRRTAAGSAAQPESDPDRSPEVPWRPWTAPLALLVAFLFAAVGSLIVDIPAALFGVKIKGEKLPPGISLADTFVQDAAFVLAAVMVAYWFTGWVRSWQFGLRRPGQGWRTATLRTLLVLAAFLILSVAFESAVNAPKEKLLEELGAGEGTAMLVLTALLTCAIAPICEEFLFRGYIFSALRNWRGTGVAAVLTGLLFGGVHAGSAPAVDLVPLAILGVALCLLYRWTGSLYPGIAVHSLNNSIAFAGLEGWSWQLPVLAVGALATIAAIDLGLRRAGIIEGGRLPRAAGLTSSG
ncbi:MAG TPA: type II CAAX endopeptidase family protein [Solirubrobacteraceae bacterium]|nr:type II CAAX endopeptidase family protein [Solirubrobacteraceae bacterium]